jgi:hypothetical protein
MAVNLANVNSSTSTFYNWLIATNQLCANLSHDIVTANSTLAITTGTGYVNGQFLANTFTVTTGLGGGSITFPAGTIAPATLILTTNVTMNSASYVAGSTGVTLSGSTPQAVDSFSISSFRSVKYLLQISTSAGYQATEIMLLQDGTNVFMTEYATLANNGSMGVFSASLAAGTVTLYVTPTQSTSTVKFERTSLSA